MSSRSKYIFFGVVVATEVVRDVRSEVYTRITAKSLLNNRQAWRRGGTKTVYVAGVHDDIQPGSLVLWDTRDSRSLSTRTSPSFIIQKVTVFTPSRVITDSKSPPPPKATTRSEPVPV